MKNETLEMKREVWEYFRLYRQAPFKKRYLEKLGHDEGKPTKKYKEMYF